jgi:hypothetical protein
LRLNLWPGNHHRFGARNRHDNCFLWFWHDLCVFETTFEQRDRRLSLFGKGLLERHHPDLRFTTLKNAGSDWNVLSRQLSTAQQGSGYQQQVIYSHDSPLSQHFMNRVSFELHSPPVPKKVG